MKQKLWGDSIRKDLFKIELQCGHWVDARKSRNAVPGFFWCFLCKKSLRTKVGYEALKLSDPEYVKRVEAKKNEVGRMRAKEFRVPPKH